MELEVGLIIRMRFGGIECSFQVIGGLKTVSFVHTSIRREDLQSRLTLCCHNFRVVSIS